MKGINMSLFPSASLGIYDNKDLQVTQRMEHFYEQVISPNSYFWAEAKFDQQVEAGDPNIFDCIYGYNALPRLNKLSFNRVKRIVNMIDGYQRRNRKSIQAIPVENGDQLTADQYTKIFMWINQQESMQETISDAFRGALISGLSLLQIWMDYRHDPISGDIKIDNCSYNTFLIDPFFKKADLSDCSGIWKRSLLTKQEIINLMPDKKEEIDAMPHSDARDGKFNFLPENIYTRDCQFMAYDEFYYRDYRDAKIIIDIVTGETREWKINNDELLRQFIQTNPQLTVIKKSIPTNKVAIVVQGKCVYDDINPMGIDRMPFVPVFCYFNPDMSDYRYRLQGVVRGLRDAQFIYNQRKAIELDTLQSQVNSGYIYKPGSLIDPRDIYKTGQGKGIALKQEAQMTDVQQILAPVIPPTTIQLSEIIAKEIQEISGVSDVMVGAEASDVAGIITMLRQNAGQVTLQGIYDSLDRSMRNVGKLLLDCIQNNFSSGKVKRIIAEEPSPQFYDKSFGVYDVAVEDGFNTSTQRQLQFGQLMMMKQAGVPIPDDILVDACTLQNKGELVEFLKNASQQQAQLAQARQQAETLEIQARVELARARAAADTGLFMERTSRVAENKATAVQKKAEAVRDENQATLNMAKALSELDDMDLNKLQKLISLRNMIKQEENVTQQEIGNVQTGGQLEEL
jgi:hypothetical protein